MLQVVARRLTRVGAGAAIRALPAAFEAEQDRWFLWVPVLFGVGIWAYFTLAVEPTLTATLVPVGMALTVALVWRESGAALPVTSALLAATLGHAAAKLRSERVAAPVLAEQTRPLSVTGWIELIEPRPERGERVTLRVASIDELPREQWPKRVRVRTLVATPASLLPGDGVRVVAMLSPPAGPALPDGFDFARSAWFQGLGAVGYSRNAIERAQIDTPPDWDVALRGTLERTRRAIGTRITAALPGEAGAIANALITGERGGITEATNNAFRDSGLFHIMSISGLHMVIMAGAVFFSVRFLLSLVPLLALRFSIKKWAATAAAAGAFGYLLLSGSTTPTVRSWIMISIMYLAVLLDRPAVAPRNVALAALAILVLWPESLIDVGFQMSFAAVVALVSAYEAVREREDPGRAPRGGPVWQATRLFGGIVLSTLIASIAVAPLAAFHFHVSQQYAILANLIAIPICNLVVMPAALATLVAMPFGLEAWPLMVMGWGIDGMVWCAYTVAALPGAVARLPAFSSTAFAMMVAGGIWIALWQRQWRWLGVIPVLIGFALATRIDKPDILVGRGGKLLAVRADDGRLMAVGDAAGRFDLSRWLEHDGDARRPEAVLASGALRCDWTGCTGSVRSVGVALNRHPAGLADDCAGAVIVVVVGRRPVTCEAAGAGLSGLPAARDRTPDTKASLGEPYLRWLRADSGSKLILHEPELTRAGPFAIYLRAGGVVDVRTVAQSRGERPWSAKSPEQPSRARAPRATSRVRTDGASRTPRSPSDGAPTEPRRDADPDQ
jgi:competence protein ComEC